MFVTEGIQSILVSLAIFITFIPYGSIPDLDPVEATDEIVQQYVDRYALKEPSPRVYTDIELKALQILQERVRYQSEFDTRQVSEDRDDESTSSANGRSRAEINAIKRWVYRHY